MKQLYEASLKPTPHQLLELLVSRDKTLDLSEFHSLHPIFAVVSPEGLGALLAAGAPADLLDESGYSPIMLQPGRRHSTETITLLLKHGADPFRKLTKQRDWNLFDFVMRKGCVEDLKILIDAFPDRGREQIRLKSKRLLDQYNWNRLVPMLEYIRNDLFSTCENDASNLFVFSLAAIATALSYADEDEDFYATVAALISFSPNCKHLNFEDSVCRQLSPHLFQCFRFEIFHLLPQLFQERVRALLICFNQIGFRPDKNLKHELIYWLAAAEVELIDLSSSSSSGD